MANLKFIKKSIQPTAEAGIIWFNPTTQSLYLCEDGSSFKNYTGVRNASYTNKVLTIVNESGQTLSLDFSDVPSAEGVSSLLAAIRTDVNKNKSDISTLTSNLSTANTNIANNTKAIGDEVTRATKAEGDLTEALNQEISDREGAINEVNTAANTLKGRVDGHDTKIANLETSVGTDDTKGLRKRVKDLEGTVGSGETGLVGTAANHESRIDALEASVGASGDIGSRLAAVESQASTNADNISTNTSAISGHGTRIEALEAAVQDGGTLEKRVDAIETLITADGEDNTTIDKVSEVIKWFEGVSETESGATLLSDVATLKNTTVPGVKSTADSALAKANTAQSEIDALEEAVGSGFSKTSTVASQLAAVKSTADAALPAATFNSFKTTNTQAIADAKAAGTAAQGTADTALSNAAAAQAQADKGVQDAADALAAANAKVASVAVSGDDYITVSNDTSNTATNRKMKVALDVATDIASLTADNKQVANAKSMKDYVDSQILTSINSAMEWSEWN